MAPSPSGAFSLLHVNPATVRELQMALNRRGYHAGSVDGAMGPVTAEALGRFQAANGLEPTGRTDLRTLALLDLLPDEWPQASGHRRKDGSVQANHEAAGE